MNINLKKYFSKILKFYLIEKNARFLLFSGWSSGTFHFILSFDLKMPLFDQILVLGISLVGYLIQQFHLCP